MPFFIFSSLYWLGIEFARTCPRHPEHWVLKDALPGRGDYRKYRGEKKQSTGRTLLLFLNLTAKPRDSPSHHQLAVFIVGDNSNPNEFHRRVPLCDVNAINTIRWKLQIDKGEFTQHKIVPLTDFHGLRPGLAQNTS